MKRTTLLLIPLMFSLSSCVNFGDTPVGTEFIPNTSSETKVELEYFTNSGEEINKTNPVASFSFRNDLIKSSPAITNQTQNEILDLLNENKDQISNFIELDRVYKGPYGLKLEYLSGKTNGLGITFAKSFKYIEIVCCASFTNSLDYLTGENIFSSKEAAINLNGSKYVKLSGEKHETENKTNEVSATFSLKEPTNTIKLHAENHSVIIYEINLFN